jgi:drug/metabolite transporter (DMT)-like permease
MKDTFISKVDFMIKPKRQYLPINKIPGSTYLWLAMLIFGASSAITRKLTEIGAHNFIGGRNPISLCNVLFVGNLCAVILMIFIYGREWNPTNLNKLAKKDWINLTIVAILSGALAPGLFFQALALTTVNNVILVGRVEPPLTIALSFWLLKERVSIWELMGAITASIGVALTIFLQPAGEGMMNMAGFHLGIGEILVVFASLSATISTIISKKYLNEIPLGITNIFRTGLGTVIFFCTALILYGQGHFADVFAPFLWQWMFLYGGLIVVVGHSLLAKGLKTANVSTASVVGSFTPIVGIISAYFILNEVPTMAQLIGGSVILLGIFFSQFENIYQKSGRAKVAKITSAKTKQVIESNMGFKGL